MFSSLPKIVYKYRDWTECNHRKIVSHRQLYIASPKDFNDPFDCRITHNFGLLNSDKKIKEYVRVLGDRNRENLATQGQRPEDYADEIFNSIKDNKEEEQKNWDIHTFKMQDDHYGIVSLSAIWDSILMWGHYARNHTGFCVGFNEERLQNSRLFGKGGMVKYRNEFPKVNPIEDYTPQAGFRQTHTKALDWDYEKEYRLFKLFTTKPTKPEDRIVELDKSFYSEIVIGLKFPDDQVDTIMEIAKDIGVPLYRTKQIPFKFKLTRERVA
ncbi:MAG: DUF2971 domain-containing protein [Bacteroidetes bacterium]|nr:DUF2971 domain-containing protein [Bacteroidota bacterium]